MIIQCKGPTTVASFKTVEEAKESTGAKNIGKVLHGDFKTSNGYGWKEENAPECPSARFIKGVDNIVDHTMNGVDDMVDSILKRMTCR